MFLFVCLFLEGVGGIRGIGLYYCLYFFCNDVDINENNIGTNYHYYYRHNRGDSPKPTRS